MSTGRMSGGRMSGGQLSGERMSGGRMAGGRLSGGPMSGGLMSARLAVRPRAACVGRVSSFTWRRAQTRPSRTSTVAGSTAAPSTPSCRRSPTSGRRAAASTRWGEITSALHDYSQR